MTPTRFVRQAQTMRAIRKNSTRLNKTSRQSRSLTESMMEWSPRQTGCEKQRQLHYPLQSPSRCLNVLREIPNNFADFTWLPPVCRMARWASSTSSH